MLKTFFTFVLKLKLKINFFEIETYFILSHEEGFVVIATSPKMLKVQCNSAKGQV